MGIRRSLGIAVARSEGRAGGGLVATLAAAAALSVAAACGAGSGDASSASGDLGQPAETTDSVTTSGGAQECAANRHGIVVDVDGTLTVDAIGDLGRWLTDPTYDPLVRPGAVDLLNAWRSRGYEIVYLTGRPPSLMIGDVPIADATATWLESHGFPTGEGTHTYFWDNVAVPQIERYKAQALIDLASEGLSVDYAYTGSPVDVGAYRTAGIAPDHIFTVGDAADEPGTVAVRESGWLAHQVSTVDPLPKVCA
jgi:hypothetical protein